VFLVLIAGKYRSCRLLKSSKMKEEDSQLLILFRPKLPQ